MSAMQHDYSISVRWAKGNDVQLGTYELSGNLSELVGQAYEKSIKEGTPLVLAPDSEFFRYFKQSDGK